MLKGGLVYADAITTVSNTYAEEIKTPFYGEGLDGLYAGEIRDLRGIVNVSTMMSSTRRRIRISFRITTRKILEKRKGKK